MRCVRTNLCPSELNCLQEAGRMDEADRLANEKVEQQLKQVRGVIS